MVWDLNFDRPMTSATETFTIVSNIPEHAPMSQWKYTASFQERQQHGTLRDDTDNKPASSLGERAFPALERLADEATSMELSRAPQMNADQQRQALQLMSQKIVRNIQNMSNGGAYLDEEVIRLAVSHSISQRGLPPAETPSSSSQQLLGEGHAIAQPETDMSTINNPRYSPGLRSTSSHSRAGVHPPDYLSDETMYDHNNPRYSPRTLSTPP
jgi:hypothetical protein